MVNPAAIFPPSFSHRARSWALGLALAILVLPSLAHAASPVPNESSARNSARDSAPAIATHSRAFRSAHEAEILAELRALVALPNLASDDAAIRQNAALLRSMFEKRGFAVRILEAPGSPPAVFAERREEPPAGKRPRPTVMLYAHYDGQPVDPREWASPPFEPTLRDAALEAGGKVVPWGEAKPPFGREWRLYARSSSDDKGPIVAWLAALDALDAAGIDPSIHLKVFLEGEEEAGSTHLADMLARHRDLLAADAWLFADGPVHPSRAPQVVFGVRGVLGLEMTVYGPLRPLHSGHYGNWAPNPAVQLADLLARLRSPEGEVRVPGFLDSVRALSAAERAALAALPQPDADLRHELGLAATEGGGALLAERILLPAMNVRGIAAGAVGSSAANAIPTEARASIDFRLVPDQRPERVRAAFEAELARLGFTLVDREPDLETRRAHPKLVRLEWETGGYAGVRTALDDPLSRAVLALAGEAAGRPVLAVPALGGSLPLAPIVDTFGVPLVLVPTVNHDNRQHAANENLRLANLWDAIDLFAVLFARLGEEWSPR